MPQGRTLFQQQKLLFDENEYKKSVQREILKSHTRIYDQVFSPDGHYLVACDSFGYISVWDLRHSLNRKGGAGNHEPLSNPCLKFQACNGSIFSLASTKALLICGTYENVLGWRWSDIYDACSNYSDSAWHRSEFKRPVFATRHRSKSMFSMPSEVNQLATSECERFLYAGCGDNEAYIWDIEKGGKQIGELAGHTDYIHCITLRGKNGVVTGSEDGSVRLWDTRTMMCYGNFEPYSDFPSCIRGDVEGDSIKMNQKWIGCIDIDSCGDWLVCGGSPHLSLWHLPSMTATTAMRTSGNSQVAFFHEDQIISAGEDSHIYHWTRNGKMTSKVPTDLSSVFSVRINSASPSTKILSASGNSSSIDVFINFGAKSCSFSSF
eukprot:Nk52_evm13s442 gene=Nk52_evmTU13s442